MKQVKQTFKITILLMATIWLTACTEKTVTGVEDEDTLHSDVFEHTSRALWQFVQQKAYIELDVTITQHLEGIYTNVFVHGVVRDSMEIIGEDSSRLYDEDYVVIDTFSTVGQTGKAMFFIYEQYGYDIPRAKYSVWMSYREANLLARIITPVLINRKVEWLKN